MKPTAKPARNTVRPYGQSTVEFTVICSILAAMLFATQTPAGKDLAQSLRTFYTNLTLFISLP